MPALRNLRETRPTLDPQDNAPFSQRQADQPQMDMLGGGQQGQPDSILGGGRDETARQGFTPRENFAPQLRQPGSGGADSTSQAAPQRPEEPTPMSGSTQIGSSEGVLPFQPMGGPSPSMMTKPQGSSLFGSMGGLQGGGLGVPLDPTPNAASDPITNLIQMLLGRS